MAANFMSKGKSKSLFKPGIRLPDLGKEQALRVGTTGGTQEEGTTRGKKE